MSKKTPTRRVRLEDGRIGTTTDPIGGVGGFVSVILYSRNGTPGKTKPNSYPADKVEFLEP